MRNSRVCIRWAVNCVLAPLSVPLSMVIKNSFIWNGQDGRTGREKGGENGEKRMAHTRRTQAQPIVGATTEHIYHTFTSRTEIDQFGTSSFMRMYDKVPKVTFNFTNFAFPVAGHKKLSNRDEPKCTTTQLLKNWMDPTNGRWIFRRAHPIKLYCLYTWMLCRLGLAKSFFFSLCLLMWCMHWAQLGMLLWWCGYGPFMLTPYTIE